MKIRRRTAVIVGFLLLLIGIGSFFVWLQFAALFVPECDQFRIGAPNAHCRTPVIGLLISEALVLIGAGILVSLLGWSVGEAIRKRRAERFAFLGLRPGDRIVREGFMLYDGRVRCPVRVVRTRMRPGSGDYEDEPELANDQPGIWFRIDLTAAGDPNRWASHVEGLRSMQEALAELEKYSVEWKERPPPALP